MRSCILVTTLFTALASGAAAQSQPKKAQPKKAQPKKARSPRVDPLPGKPNKARRDLAKLRPAIRGTALRKSAQKALERGFAFLVRTQNFDGTWGSHDPKLANLKNFGFGTGNRGSNDGVRLACTSIIALALLRHPKRSAAEEKTLVKAITEIVRTNKFAYNMGESFNIWGYTYKLTFLVEFLAAGSHPKFTEQAEAAAKLCIQKLKRYQGSDGGWNYYNSPHLEGRSMSFLTGNAMEALEHARRLGLPVPKGMIGDAQKLLLRMRTKRGGVVYDARFLHSGGSVNELSSAARTAACVEALAQTRRYGKPQLKRALAIFNEGENWLEHGRKLIQPHTAVHQVSGYFFFYGYHYLSEFLVRLGDTVPVDRWERNAWTMIRTQEANGSWWDTPAADYGDKWGTGFALLTLQRYLDAVPARNAAKIENKSGGNR